MIYGGKRMAIENDDKNSIHWEISEEDFRNAKIDCFVLEGEEKMLVGLRYGEDKSNTRVLALAKGDFKKDRGLIREIAKAFQKLIINPTLEQINDQPGAKGKSVNIDNISMEDIAQMCDGNLEVTEQCRILMDKLKSGDFDVFRNGEKLEIPKTDVYKDNHVYSVMSEQDAKRVVGMETKKGFEEYWNYLRELKQQNPHQYEQISRGNRMLDAITKFVVLDLEIKSGEITDEKKAEAVEDYLNQVPNFEVASILEYLGTSENPKYQQLAACFEGVQKGDEKYISKIQVLLGAAKIMLNEFQVKYQEDISEYTKVMQKFDIGFRLEAFREKWQEDAKKIKLGEKFSQYKKDNKILQADFKKSNVYKQALEEARKNGEPDVPDR